MGRGAFYTEEEDAALMNLWEDKKPKDNFIDVARRAKRYTLSPGRSEEAIAQRLSRLVKKDEEEGEFDPEIAIAQKAYNEIDRKYKGLLNAVIGSATLFGENSRALKLNFHAISKWIYENEPEMVTARISELGGGEGEEQC